MGARSITEARAFLLARYRRRWGVAFTRERARLRISRLPFVDGGLGRRSMLPADPSRDIFQGGMRYALMEGMHPLVGGHAPARGGDGD
jgi:hypothetical protein